MGRIVLLISLWFMLSGAIVTFCDLIIAVIEKDKISIILDSLSISLFIIIFFYLFMERNEGNE